MKNIKISLLIIIILFINCTKTLDEIDTDPNNSINTSTKSLITFVTTGVPFFIGTDLSWYSSIFCEQTAGVHGILLNIDIRTAGLKGNNYSWNNIYSGLLKDLDIIIQKSTNENNETAIGIAKILKSYVFCTLTDLFGDIPYSEALKFPEIEYPKYDKQEDIYTGILDELDIAIIFLLNNKGIVQDEDLIFSGDNEKWIKTAYALKARIMNKLVGKINNPKISDDHILEAISKSFSSSNDNFKFSKFSNTNGWQNTWKALENKKPEEDGRGTSNI